MICGMEFVGNWGRVGVAEKTGGPDDWLRGPADRSLLRYRQPLPTGREPDAVGGRRFHSVCHRAPSLARAHGAVDHDPALERLAFSALPGGAGSAPFASPGCADP